MEYSSISTPPSGSIRFNTDSRKMEIYNGDKWWEIDSTTGTDAPRWVTGGGYQPGVSNIIQYAQINTTANTVDFGDAVIYGRSGAAQSNGHGGL